MRVVLILNDEEGRALTRRSAIEDRPIRDQARRIVREGLVALGDLTPAHRPCDQGMMAVSRDLEAAAR